MQKPNDDGPSLKTANCWALGWIELANSLQTFDAFRQSPPQWDGWLAVRPSPRSVEGFLKGPKSVVFVLRMPLNMDPGLTLTVKLRRFTCWGEEMSSPWCQPSSSPLAIWKCDQALFAQRTKQSFWTSCFTLGWLGVVVAILSHNQNQTNLFSR